MSVLLADIGGTHARFAILKSGRLSDIYRYRCSDLKSAYMAIRSFLLMQTVKPKYAVIAMAGVVMNGQGKWTNLPWSLSEKRLKEEFGFYSVMLVNDLIPQGVGIACLKASDIVALNKAKPQKKSLKVLMSLGTGLGACIIGPDAVYPTEYGQTMLSDGSVLEKSLSAYGLKSVYEKHAGKALSASTIERHLRQGQEHAVKAYEHFYGLLAQTAQNMALSVQPMGGLYLAGGMLSIQDLKKSDFAAKFINHPTMHTLLKNVPVYLIVNKDLAFIGLSKLAKKSCWT
ncbi:MAG: glucokinase [Alphaproteobacteria bacterium]|nr:glucokinase [Alphaproteobacteria bacterium]